MLSRCAILCGCVPHCVCLCRCRRFAAGLQPRALDPYELVLLVDNRERLNEGKGKPIAEGMQQLFIEHGIGIRVRPEKASIGDYGWVWRRAGWV